MITTISRYQRLGLALTVRTSYEDIVIPQGLIPQKLVRNTHGGFAEYEYQATCRFSGYMTTHSQVNVPPCFSG